MGVQEAEPLEASEISHFLGLQMANYHKIFFLICIKIKEIQQFVTLSPKILSKIIIK